MSLVRGEWVSDGNDVSHLVGGDMDEEIARLTRERDDWKRTAELAQRIATIAIEKFRDALDQHDRFAADTKARMTEMEALVAKAGLAPSDWMWPGYDKTGAL